MDAPSILYGELARNNLQTATEWGRRHNYTSIETVSHGDISEAIQAVLAPPDSTKLALLLGDVGYCQVIGTRGRKDPLRVFAARTSFPENTPLVLSSLQRDLPHRSAVLTALDERSLIYEFPFDSIEKELLPNYIVLRHKEGHLDLQMDISWFSFGPVLLKK